MVVIQLPVNASANQASEENIVKKFVNKVLAQMYLLCNRNVYRDIRIFVPRTLQLPQ